MPGLVGIITGLSRQHAEAALQKMVAALRHEQSCVDGTWVDTTLGIYVGWVERNASFAKSNPIKNESGDLTLMFSGEDFPEIGAAQRLRERGHSIDVSGPSYLVHMAEEDGSFPKCLNGQFQGVLADRNRRSVTLFNDRYGLHRIYFHEGKDAFYFAAEAKAILAVCPEVKSVDPARLSEYVSCGCTLENRSIFRNVGVLPPASAWVFQQSAIALKKSYFEAKEWEEQSQLESELYYRQLRDVFARNLPRYCEGQRQIGISLTGGLDSRMIMSWAKVAPASVPCYSFGSSYRESQDVQIGRRVALACGQEHQVIQVGDEFLSQFPRYAERTVYLSDGCVDVKHAPDLYVNELAAKIAPVRLTGNYGGEILRQVRAFKPSDPAPELYCHEIVARTKQVKETFQGLYREHPLSFAAFRQAPWHHQGLLALERSQLTVRSPFLDNEFVKTVYCAPHSALKNDNISLRLIADGNTDLYRIRTDRGLGGSLPSWLSAVTRAYLEFSFKAEYAYDYGMPQSIVRVDHAFARLHPERLFLGRHKFYHYRVWYRDILSSYVREMLLDQRALSRPYLKCGALEAIVNEHLEGRRNHTTTIHKILTLEHLHRLFIDSI